MTEVVFTDLTGYVAEEYFPRPARKAIPEWYLKLSSHRPDSKDKHFSTQTAKRCVPMLDAFSSGYMLFTVVDIRVSHDENGQLLYQWASEHSGAVDFQQTWQVDGHAKITSAYGTIPKMPNPWGIKTPRGVSCLIIPPVNQDSAVFEIFSGVIDTDEYNLNGGFPFRLLDPSFEGLIPAGTPMAQVIPFKRDSFVMRMGTEQEAVRQNRQAGKLRSVFMNGYRSLFWSRKEYR